MLRLFGNPHIQDEELLDYELGYRAEFTRGLSADVVSFLSFYHHLETVEPQAMVIVPGSSTQFEIPMLYDNKAHATTYGGEASLNWTVGSR